MSAASGRLMVVVLAAGRSRRFGARNKLLASFTGKPVAKHVARTLKGFPKWQGAIVTRDPVVARLFAASGLRQVIPPAHPRTQSVSLQVGIRHAMRQGATHILLLLADMPLVRREDLDAVLRAGGLHPVLSQGGKQTMPPALFSRALFPALMRLEGDVGAAKVLRRRPDLVRCALLMAHLRDIDRPGDISGR